MFFACWLMMIDLHLNKLKTEHLLKIRLIIFKMELNCSGHSENLLSSKTCHLDNFSSMKERLSNINHILSSYFPIPPSDLSIFLSLYPSVLFILPSFQTLYFKYFYELTILLLFLVLVYEPKN